MHNYQMDSNNSAFKMPFAPQPLPPHAETLLFNDILEENTAELRQHMMEFLQVYPYRKFRIEFSKFLKHTKGLMLEGQRSGENISRLTVNSSQIAAINSRPSSSFNYRQPATMSMMNSNRNSTTLQYPESSFQPIETLNPFKPPSVVNQLQPRVVLPRIEQSSYSSNHSPSICATVIEVSQSNNNVSRRSTYCRTNSQSLEPIDRPQSPTPNAYSDVTMTENDEVSDVQQNDNSHNESNSIEVLLGEAGFKIVSGIPDTSKMTKSNASQHDKNQLNLVENVEKYLSRWSVNTKIIKSQTQKSSKIVVIITGVLLGEDKVTVLEKRHEAGAMECRKEINLVRTKNGMYRLLGNIIGGSPNEFYQACLVIHGIPKNWKKMLHQLSGIEKDPKNVLLDFTLDSPAGPIKPIKPIKSKTAINLDMSITRNGTTYSKNSNIGSTKTNRKRKLSEHDTLSKSKQRKIQEKLPPMSSSTPKRPGKKATFESPSQILRNKLQQNILHKTNAKSNSRTLTTLNDSIKVTKKRQSISKEQFSEFVKPIAPTKSSLGSNNGSKRNSQSTNSSSVASCSTSSKRNSQATNSSSVASCSTSSKRNSQATNNSSVASCSSSSKQSKQKSVNNSNILNSITNSTEQSKSQTAANNSTPTLKKLDQSKQKLSSKNISNIKIKSQQTTINKDGSAKLVKVVKQTKPKEKTVNKVSLKETAPNNKENNKLEKGVPKPKTTDNKNVDKKKSKEFEMKRRPAQTSSSRELDLFGNIDTADYGNINDFNEVMASPSKLSAVSRGDNSRSETPPLFNNQWSSTAKSLVASEPPTPLSKSTVAKALKRVKAPKITAEEELKNHKKNITKQSIDFKTVTNKINKMLEYGSTDYDD